MTLIDDRHLPEKGKFRKSKSCLVIVEDEVLLFTEEQSEILPLVKRGAQFGLTVWRQCDGGTV